MLKSDVEKITFVDYGSEFHRCPKSNFADFLTILPLRGTKNNRTDKIDIQIISIMNFVIIKTWVYMGVLKKLYTALIHLIFNMRIFQKS